MAAQEVRFTDGDVEWVGATIGDGTDGRYVFGRDSKGHLHIEIVCDKRPIGGILQVNRVEIDDAPAVLAWLTDFTERR